MPARRQHPVSRLLAPTAAVAVATLLAGCSSAVTIQPAADAANPACAPVMLALPDTLGDAAIRTTTSQATAAWGDPSAVVLRCGVASPGPTTDRCVSVNGVDWVIKEDGPSSDGATTRAPQPSGEPSGQTGGQQDSGTYTLTTFGRSPAVELLLDAGRISSATVLASLSPAVSKIPATRHCVGQADLATLGAGG